MAEDLLAYAVKIRRLDMAELSTDFRYESETGLPASSDVNRYDERRRAEEARRRLRFLRYGRVEPTVYEPEPL